MDTLSSLTLESCFVCVLVLCDSRDEKCYAIMIICMIGNILGFSYCKFVATGKESVLLKEEFITYVDIRN